MDEKTLKLKAKEITIILQALSERPHKEVISIINKIVEQTTVQQMTVSSAHSVYRAEKIKK